ncbi:malto-oligosyltrehalose trehalohydrolase [Candidatus Magnetobacterium casense]|uniref:Malto-oligosyltrehalose trehalohydrolase n=1 Tax=Candidatus Magnetobacterium casense TaxID=1455061 RepID=A0ABS6RY61_9BACT|nr:malto-oligosyltrehalose trehalohydrolase [Candidatus Magnetobacterium casensis]MBV6341516.1 malto-oligosyltrehalose trehalohydrolase [Candidatus Magnetobacterium casensis]
MKNGANYLGAGRCRFTLWAPLSKVVELNICPPTQRRIPMRRDHRGYWETTVDDVTPQTCYTFILDNEREIPDPASHYQPQGVHKPSQVVDHDAFMWTDAEFKGIDVSQMIMYELHVGTFTEAGTFEAIIARLNDLVDLGVNAIDLMPVTQFPGERNWGYDSVYPYAVQNSYGGPHGLKTLVNECHRRGLAVILDVIYNHIGPEGNYLWGLAHYFTDRYKTGWGNAINFDGPHSDEVRTYFIENALHWFGNYHIDALRLDAVHAIYDMGARHLLQELSERTNTLAKATGRNLCLVAESDLNDSRVIKPIELGGYGMDAQWCDDYHHALHTILTGERNGYYSDFGTLRDMVSAIRDGYVYCGAYSRHRNRAHGNSPEGRPDWQFVVFSQNHDQIGNRMLGERLSALVSFEALKLAAATVLLSPYVPMLFMGEEYAEDAPFLYFISHGDPALIKAVRSGRKKEFREFAWKGTPPDPQDTQTFMRSKLHWEKRNNPQNNLLLEFYKALISLRKGTPALSPLYPRDIEVYGQQTQRIVILDYKKARDNIACIFNLSAEEATTSHPMLRYTLDKVLDSADTIWGGDGAKAPDVLDADTQITVPGLSVSVYRKSDE